MPAGLRSSSTAPFAAPYPTTDLGGGTEIGSRQDWYSSQRLAFLEQVHARSASALDGKRPAGRELRSAGVASVLSTAELPEGTPTLEGVYRGRRCYGFEPVPRRDMEATNQTAAATASRTREPSWRDAELREGSVTGKVGDVRSQRYQDAQAVQRARLAADAGFGVVPQSTPPPSSSRLTAAVESSKQPEVSATPAVASPKVEAQKGGVDKLEPSKKEMTVTSTTRAAQKLMDTAPELRRLPSRAKPPTGMPNKPYLGVTFDPWTAMPNEDLKNLGLPVTARTNDALREVDDWYSRRIQGSVLYANEERGGIPSDEEKMTFLKSRTARSFLQEEKLKLTKDGNFYNPTFRVRAAKATKRRGSGSMEWRL
ncbi:hypothetical protein PPROV_000080700 [Pycnococcus provasolii]|uniref:Uncharacterized protein n=1 Tax=Pycnococcus provasolii TaxID=41880 RepID=A0A830H8T4_9CHLO|nr:hypothetical protein PPROV_000080700 [Pycnococcus provasolii]